MGLSKVERERVSDSRLKLKSVARSLQHVDPRKIENLDDIQECLDTADQSLRRALQTADDSAVKN